MPKKLKNKIRYAVVGLGHISQVAVLPAFKHAKNSELVALISSDPVKLKKLSKKYHVKHTYSYEQYDDCLRSGEIDAIYIALPNNMHREYTERAAQAGIHVLCEKPMAVTEQDSKAMFECAQEHNTKLMIAYRLHFEEGNMQAVKIAQSGKLGELRLFNSVFTMQVKNKNNIRLQDHLGGGTLYDIGIYCINAARYIFQDEPLEVFAFSANNGDTRFEQVEEMVTAVMRFPKERLATFTASFGAVGTSMYEIVGTKGKLRVEPAFEYAEALKHEITINGKTLKKKFARRDQFAAELHYFSNCVLKNEDPQPSGLEGMADVQIIRALYESAKRGQLVKIHPSHPEKRPNLTRTIRKPPVQEPTLVNTSSTTKD
ncbi:MAG: Gfo/Idh/MocA family oxidoreductase [Oligoflexia bacterium]|nr:Gfo/Idh/MocA family oxidoreductase [Oligoflexia bacterium]